MQSEQLTKFYQAYSDWLDAGAPCGKPFYRFTGLCYNYKSVFGAGEIGLKEMIDQFKVSGLDRGYPFGGDDQYDKCAMSEEMHLDPNRIAWVKAHI